MSEALRIARRGEGRVEPNPMVGAVVVRGGKVVGRGYHRRFGGPHAEVFALQEAGERARGATLYVSLEPCCHFGKTPPCTDAIIRAGIRRVVAAMPDPNPLVAGKGIDRLRTAGVEVAVGVLEAEARRLNAPFVKLMVTRTPFVIAKWAMSLDGKIATARGESRWISSDVSRRFVHSLRGTVDGLVVGIGTVLRDDPRLLAEGSPRRIATRIVLDSKARTPLESKLVQTIGAAPLLVVATERARQVRVNELRSRGAEVLLLAETGGRPDIRSLLKILGERQFTKLLVEGGGSLLASFFEDRLVDRVHAFIAPKLIGGRTAPTPFDGTGFAHLRDILHVRDMSYRRMGPDILLTAELGLLPAPCLRR